MMPTPLKFEPYLRPQPWGHRRLAAVFDRAVPMDSPVGESWELSAHPVHVSRVADGPLAGRSLCELWESERDGWCGDAAPQQFPWLLKFLDCHEYLSVQVHPGDATAAALRPGENGKTEAWVVLDADPAARIFAGFRPGVTRGEVVERLEDGSLVECLHSFVPRAGDCVFLPAGTVHAVGGGVLMAEVQQSSDATFRLFDWNRVGLDGRPRTLHREESLASIDWAAGPVNPVRPRSLPNLPEHVRGEALVDCHWFRWDRFQFADGPWSLTPTFAAWTVIAGSATLSGSGFHRRYRAGETVLTTGSEPDLTWQPHPRTTLLRVTLPAARPMLS